jgi:hypothetical protein
MPQVVTQREQVAYLSTNLEINRCEFEPKNTIALTFDEPF